MYIQSKGSCEAKCIAMLLPYLPTGRMNSIASFVADSKANASGLAGLMPRHAKLPGVADLLFFGDVTCMKPCSLLECKYKSFWQA